MASKRPYLKLRIAMNDRNENRLNYKKTRVGWIPKNWMEYQLRHLIEKGPQNGLYKNEDSYGDGYRMVHMTHLFADNVISDQQMPLVKLSEKEIKQYLIQNKDLLFGRRSIAIEGAGKCSIVLNPSTPLTFESSIIRITLKRDIAEPKYVFYYIENPFGRYQMYTFTRVVAVSGVAGSDLKLYRLALPPLEEQKIIAELFSVWDDTIIKTRHLIATKKNRKKALVQKLVEPSEKQKDSKKEKWNAMPLRELLSPVSRPVPKPSTPYLAIGLRSHGKGTFQRMVEEPDKVAMDTLFRIEKDDIIVNITFAWEGAIAIANGHDERGLVSHRFPTFRAKKNAELSFLRQLFLTKRFVWDLGLISPGGAGRNRVLNKTDFLNLEVYAPPKEVQQKIGQILSTADKEIELLEDKLVTLERQKRGLMQKRLTGEVRVKV